MVDATIIGAGVTIVLAILGSSWRLSSQIRGIESKVGSLTERIDRAGLETLRDRVTTIEARCPLCGQGGPTR